MKNFVPALLIASSLGIVLPSCVSQGGGESSKSEPPSFSNLTMGKTPQYHIQKDKPRHDLSGAATDGKYIVTVDDGGKPAEYQSLRSMNMDLSDNRGFKLSQHHKDLEGATWQNGYFVITSSMGKAEPKDSAFRLTTRFKWDGKSVSEEKTVDLRTELMSALKSKYPSNWYEKVSTTAAKKGGLNIEGLSISGENPNDLVFGLRSPLAGDIEADPKVISHTGKTILATAKGAFSGDPKFMFKEIDLEGHGVRGIEYFPSISGYLIQGGPTFKANDYSLWYLPVNSDQPKKLKLEGFEKLCRPETLVPVAEKDGGYAIVFSEEAGGACKKVDFTYIKARLLQ